MKIKKESRSAARKLFRSCFVNGTLDEDRVRKVVKGLAEEKPRGYLAILSAFETLVRVEIQKRVLQVESSCPLEAAQFKDIVDRVQKRFPALLVPRQIVNPSLVGGLRIKLGSDIWDGTVSAKLKQLEIKN